MVDELGLSTRERTYAFIKGHIIRKGYAPTRDEIADAVGLRHTHSIQRHLDMLQRTNRIRVEHGIPRGIRLVEGRDE